MVSATSPNVFARIHFLTHTNDKPLDTVCKSINIDCAVHNLTGDIPVPDNGSGNQLWEKRNVEGQIDKPFFEHQTLPVSVNNIRQGLKSEKGNAQRQMNRFHLNGLDVDSHQKGIDVVHKEIGVLKPTQQAQVQNDGRDQE